MENPGHFSAEINSEVIERIRMRDSAGAFESMTKLLNIAIVDVGLR